MKKIAFVKVGSIPYAINEFIRELALRLAKESYEAEGVRLPDQDKEIEFFPINPKQERTGTLLSLTPSIWEKVKDRIIEKYDQVIFIYNVKELGKREEFPGYEGTKIIALPIDIFNEEADGLTHIGYDTALNEIITSIQRVEDTAKSLLFEVPRLFIISIPGQRAGNLMKDVASVLGCFYLGDEEPQSLSGLATELQTASEIRPIYQILLVHEEMNLDKVQALIAEKMQLEYRQAQIDEAQCIGGSSTALDILYAKKAARAAMDWIRGEESFCEINVHQLESNRFIS